MTNLQVTSPGGTTASALYQLESGGYRTVVADAGNASIFIICVPNKLGDSVGCLSPLT